MRAHILFLFLFVPGVLFACKGGGDDADVQSTTEAAGESATAAAGEPATAAPVGNFPAEQKTDTFATARGLALPGCDHIWSADLVGDEADEVLCTASNQLWVFGADGDLFRQRLEIVGTGLPNAAWSGDRDGDGKEEFVIAFGMGRGFSTAPIKVLELDADANGATWQVRTLFEMVGERPQVTAVWGPDLYLAHFVSKYQVTGGRLRPGNVLEGERLLHMGMARVLADLDGDGDQDLAVGRVYGDEPRSDGDLNVYEGDTVTQVPTFRGVRALTAARLDDGNADALLFGDGWHFKYKDEGKGRLNIARHGANGWVTELIHELPGQFAVTKIQVKDVDGDGKPEILASGADVVYLYRRTGATWQPKELGSCLAGEFAAVRLTPDEVRVAAAGSPVTWLEL